MMTLVGLVAGASMLAFVICLVLTGIMFFTSETRREKNAALIMAIFHLVGIIASLGVWAVAR